jgi:hypothetical protein
MVFEGASLVDADHGIGIADVNCQEHAAIYAGRV